MMWRDVVGLVAVVKERGPYNSLRDVDAPARDVYANKKSARQSEFYQALAVGMKPEIMFEILAEEYREEPKLIYEGTTYYIIRNFSKSGEKLELVCSRFPMVKKDG
ncbi:phage head-tail adaptor [Paenibacillus sp. 598K]|uniref:hypothetical protein n=1 Tax=Paenibacillus sp. 598K TaxID=1117987 RepID=UPI000FF96FBD|nr:hypothetical protein [Paenibacillus sp. 598K]GBF73214.1 phage head-tail adaptor [Paenibacillus sp. 598K]